MDEVTSNHIDRVIMQSQQENKAPSLFATAFWAIVLFILPGSIVGFGFGVYSDMVAIENTNAWFAQVEVMIAMTFCIYFLILPMVFLLVRAFGDNTSVKDYLNLAYHPLGLWGKITLLTILFWGLFTLLGFMLDIPEEPFMLQLKNSSLPVWFIVLNVCALAPIVEELVFRGFLFKRIELTKLGTVGAAVITSLIFAAIHSQYSVIGVAMVFLLGLYFTWLRVKYRSTSLCIACHSVCNILTMVALYFFM
ncbi:CPBP family intramembrane metalloprotease [Thalassotalea sp. M1531]|uniref:CPBP family intramembrane metalloprotease n=1 Tax=Thalassotalea algicola TaxID=2716224 RepID=A0A7Y0LBP5_9GAMM|nr:CPBP family intramembrane glutamic endopeptidase [Thalassotalea algicola]NMP30751.1 CPBP family intramembrane metalloprotease [Thalassotalea algicola]